MNLMPASTGIAEQRPEPAVMPTIVQALVSADLGGAGLVALHIADHLRRNGRSTQVWVPGTGAASHEAARLGLAVDLYDAAPAQGRRLAPAARANWIIGRKLRRLRPGIAHIHSPGHYGALRWAVRHSGLKSVVHVQIEESPQLLRWAFRRPPDVIITCANFLEKKVRDSLPERCRDTQRIESIPNAVDTERFHSAHDKHAAKGRVQAPADVPLVLMLANLAPHKGQETAIRAMAELKRQGIDAECWLAGVERGGQTPYTTHLKRLIAELAVSDRVRLLGPRGDAADLLRAADFFLLPSTSEGLPLSLLEAQASKVPVLAAPTAGIPEVVCDRDSGFLIDASDWAGYARRLAELIASPTLAQEVAHRAYVRTTSTHNWRSLCRRVTDLYDELLPSVARHHAMKNSARTRSQAAS
jgi:glycosyltransferase involved in cell wall biosynthesis